MIDIIEVVPYDPIWPIRFAEEHARLATRFPEAVAIEHIGSTAVPGLAAKPVIDILIAVPTLLPPAVYQERVTVLGYVYRYHDDDGDRHIFCRKGMPRTHHLHIVAADDAEQLRPLTFRDYLRTHLQAAQDYAALKHTLAARFREDRPAYVEGKTAFVLAILARAAAEHS